MTLPYAMRHLPFFQILAEHADETDSSLWHEFQAAVVILRYLTDWAECPALATGTDQGIQLLKQHISETQDDAARYLLSAMLGNLLRSRSSDPGLIVGPFLAYAWLLEERTYFALAADVLQTIVEIVDPPTGPAHQQLAAIVHRRNGDLFHRHRQFDLAETHYKRELALANAIGDQALALDARTRLAAVQTTRGNLGQAETDLSAIIEEAERARELRVEAYARRARGSTMQRRGRTGDALREFYAAFLIAPDDFEREWLLGDIASCAAELGLLDTARIIHQTLARTAHTPAAQSLALVNLLEIAVWTDDQETFRALWQELLERDLARDLQLHALLYAAKGAERWQGAEAARTAYTALVDQARQAGVHDVEFIALEALKSLQSKSGQATGSLPTIRSAAATEWGDIAAAIETACRARLLTTAI